MELYVARDKSGELYFYDERPERANSSFVSVNRKEYYLLDEDLFPEVTWENSPKKLIVEP